MTSRTTRRFRESLAAAPPEVRQQARDAYRRFIEDEHHPGLRFKRVHSSEPIYTVRINRDYRALGVLDGAEMVWFWMGTHEGYERILKQL